MSETADTKCRTIMNRNDKIFVAGHRGLVGSAITRRLRRGGYDNLTLKTREELDLLDQRAVAKFFAAEQPRVVFLAAAMVGGIAANNTRRADFIYNNLQIQCNVIQQCHEHGVEKLLVLGSSCIYPKTCPQPIREDYLLTGPLEYTNEPYAIAKIAGLKMAESYALQYDRNFISAMPTNLYGPGDNYDLQNSHVLPALIRKFHLAKLLAEDDWRGAAANLGVEKQTAEKIIHDLGVTPKSVTVWGSGTPRREFLHSDDLADACVFLMEKVEFRDLIDQKNREIRGAHVNIGCGEDISIAELAETVRRIVGFDGNIIFDQSKPDGTPRKLLDVSKMTKLGWQAKTRLEDGIAAVYHELSPSSSLHM